MKKSDKLLIVGAIFCVLFIVFTFMIKTVDVQAIGPNGSSVGFAKINSYVSEKIGQSKLCYSFSEKLGYVGFLVVGFFGFIGLMQLIKTKSLKKVDKQIITLGVFYVLVLIIYILFNKFALNYRPVLEADGSLESSYPSSHTVYALFVFGTMFMQKIFNKTHTKGEKIENIISGTVLSATMIITRLFAGVHWFTDIIGSIILAASLIIMYAAVYNKLEGK